MTHEGQPTERRKLNGFEHFVCAWPLALMFVGGAIGGLCGGAAWAANTKIMSSKIAAPLRYLLVLLTGLAAGAAYFAAVVLLGMLFPGVFARS
ncbi:MAG: hypothetical protein Q8L23_09885 [Caulobacter sp.]|nr:hypothetical protein [Caulobacter sp.]